MEIKIGIQQVNREIVIDSPETSAAVESAFAEALSGNGLLTLTDEQGRKVMIQAGAIGYLDIGEENARRVGFGSV